MEFVFLVCFTDHQLSHVHRGVGCKRSSLVPTGVKGQTLLGDFFFIRICTSALLHFIVNCFALKRFQLSINATLVADETPLVA
jgi:hypothetical protein